MNPIYVSCEKLSSTFYQQASSCYSSIAKEVSSFDLKISIFQNSARESKIARTMKNVKRRCSNLKILISYVPFRTGIWPMLEPHSSETLFAGYLYVCIHVRILHLPSKSI